MWHLFFITKAADQFSRYIVKKILNMKSYLEASVGKTILMVILILLIYIYNKFSRCPIDRSRKRDS